jgi:hypothetical protein
VGNEVRAYLAECWDRPEGLSPTHLQVVHFISSQSSITTSCGDRALLLDQPTSALGPCRHDRAHSPREQWDDDDDDDGAGDQTW